MALRFKDERIIEKREEVYYCSSKDRGDLLDEIRKIIDKAPKFSIVNIELDVGMCKRKESARVVISSERITSESIGGIEEV